MQTFICSLLLSGGLLSLAPLVAQDIFTFDQVNEADWYAINDDVMGGISRGSGSISEEGYLQFKGEISLENYGGFASTRTQGGPWDWSNAKGLIARVRGDGRQYYLSLSSYAAPYLPGLRASFETEKDTWQEVRLPFSAFEALKSQGFNMEGMTLDLSQVKIMGFILADKQAGPFYLDVDWVRVY